MLKARKSLKQGQASTRHRLNKGSPTESSDLLAVLDELDLDTLADSGVGLLGLNTDLLQDDTLGVGSTTEGRGLEGGSEEALLEVEIGPALLLAVRLELAGGVETTGLSFTHLGLFLSEAVETNVSFAVLKVLFSTMAGVNS